MAKKRRKRHNRTRAAPALPPPPNQGAAPPPGAPSAPGQATGTVIGQKVLHTARKVVKTGAGEVKNTVADGAKGTGQYITQKAAQTIHAKVSEAEQDNAALETAHKAERIGEQIARSRLRKGKKMVRGRLQKRNIGKKPAANLGAARQAAGATNAVNLSNPSPPVTGAATPVTVIISGTATPLPAAPAQPKSKLHHGTAPKAKPPPAFTLHHSPTGGNSTLRDIWNTPAARFGTHVDFGTTKPGMIGRAFHKGKEAGLNGLRMGMDKAALQFHSKIDQTADDNSAFKAAHQAEQFAERPAGYVLKKGTNLAAAPVKKVSNKVRSIIHHRYLIRKQAFLRQHQTIAQARGVVMKAKALVREVMRNAKPVLTGLFVCLLVYFFCSMIVGPLAAVLSKAGAEYLVTTTYPVANQDITSSTVQWTEFQTALEQRIENIETEFPNFDEYRYDVEPMEHDPFELISYLAAMHLEFTHPDVQAEILALFGEVNPLQLVEETETRYDSDGDPYEWKILNIILHPKSFEEVVTPKLEAANAKDLYDVFMGSGGNQQAFGNPFTFNWTNSITSYYGNRPNPTGPGYDFHTGLDIGAPEGTPIRTIQDGVVVVAGWHDLYGNYIVVRNEAGISSLYAHCSALYGSVGDDVRQGRIIAAVGSTGNSSGNHLHLEIKLGDDRVNPLFYIQAYDL